jgi:hypothetical protein
MNLHRFHDHLAELPPQAESAFVVCPVAVLPPVGPSGAWQQVLYQMAFDQARSAQRPSLLERSLARAWN